MQYISYKMNLSSQRMYTFRYKSNLYLKNQKCILILVNRKIYSLIWLPPFCVSLCIYIYAQAAQHNFLKWVPKETRFLCKWNFRWWWFVSSRQNAWALATKMTTLTTTNTHRWNKQKTYNSNRMLSIHFKMDKGQALHAYANNTRRANFLYWF